MAYTPHITYLQAKVNDALGKTMAAHNSLQTAYDQAKQIGAAWYLEQFDRIGR